MLIYKTVVYIDLVILSTLAVNYLFIKACSIFLKTRLSIIRTILALTVSVGSIFLFLVPIKYIYNLRYFVGILIGLIAFKDKENKLLGISIIYMLNLSFIGSLVVFKIDNYLLLLITCILIIFIYSIEYLYKKIIKKDHHEYNVLINNQKYVGIYDTGNRSLYQDCPIVYLNQKYFSDIFIKIGSVLIDTINGTSLIDIYQGPIIFINKREYQVFYGFSNIKEDIILNYYMEGLC